MEDFFFFIEFDNFIVVVGDYVIVFCYEECGWSVFVSLFFNVIYDVEVFIVILKLNYEFIVCC